MKKSFLRFSVLAVLIVGAFGWGAATIKYRIFPFFLIRGAIYSSASSELPDARAVRVEIHRTFTRDADVAFVGDSIVASGPWADMFPHARVVNRGIPGDTGERILARLDTVRATSPQTVVTLFGINDAHQDLSVDEIVQTYSQVLGVLEASASDIIVVSTPMCGADCVVNGKVRELNVALNDMAVRREYVFVDVNATLAPNGVLEAEYTWDGIHLTAGGYSVIMESLRPFLDYHSE
jgi:lysophospholipase L1-like esterase